MTRRKTKPLPLMVVNGRQLNRGQIEAMREADRAESRGEIARVVELRDEVVTGIRSADEAEWIKAARAEDLHLAMLRGERVEEGDGRRAPKGRLRNLSRDGLELLTYPSRSDRLAALTPTLYAAGMRYRDQFELCRTDKLSSHTAYSESRGLFRPDPNVMAKKRADAAINVKAWEEAVMREVRRKHRCFHHAHDAVRVLREVAGAGACLKSLSTSGRRQGEYSARLVEALDVLADVMGLQ